jgi:hypothetical protein
MKTMGLERLDDLETIDPRPLAPWDPPVFEEINIDSDRDSASAKAVTLMATPSAVVYSDASANLDRSALDRPRTGQFMLLNSSGYSMPSS